MKITIDTETGEVFYVSNSSESDVGVRNRIATFQRLVQRATNTWDTAPAWVHRLKDKMAGVYQAPRALKIQVTYTEGGQWYDVSATYEQITDAMVEHTLHGKKIFAIKLFEGRIYDCILNRWR